MNSGTTDGGQHYRGGHHPGAGGAGPSGTGSGGTARPGGHTGERGTWAEIRGTVHDFWDTRPARPSEGRKIAGVAAALGNRYGVDPVLLRVVFVVGTFYGGAGLLFYLLGWATLPREGHTDRNTPIRLAVLVLITVLFVPAALAAFDMSGMFGLALGVLALYLLHRHFGDRVPARLPYGATGTTTNVAAQPGTRPEEGPYPAGEAGPAVPGERAPGEAETSGTDGYWPVGHGERAPEQPSEAATVETAAASGATAERPVAERSDATAETTSYVPPAPEPPRHPDDRFGQPPHQPPPTGWEPPVAGPPPQGGVPGGRRRPRYSVTLATLGVALLAGGFGITFGLAAVKVWALMLGVIGCGLLVGSFLHRGRWLILFAIPVVLATLLATVIPERPWRDYTDVVATPEHAAELAPEYSGSVGSVVLDLESTRFSRDEEAETDVTLGMGTVRVYLPPETDARITCASELGAVDCLGRERSGRDVRVTENDLGSDGPGGGAVRLNLMAKTGTVEVIRGY
ncbi:phage shock protein C (PspC) family protein [Actinopolyspora xinjiangensis]|uniref:Phage shock protein C (PspC) family protein n=1 Tax=Actinopolyspora xinjiangensis TaxID=405564 RepID=A0A1H0Q8Z4_9ACTN|nr:PspC domain-containing protein [Actinopolyspora xinjiangensis]SDP13863.1 phage shock protein C (PspC) family protein [Actinopolyspora xinjiangensis]